MRSAAIITGGSGFIGRFLIEHLVAVAPELKLYVLDTGSPSSELDVEWISADVTQREHLGTVFQRLKPSFVFHLASAGREQEPASLFRVNMLGTLHVLEAARTSLRTGHPRVLCVSSSAVYDTTEAGRAIQETHRLRPVTPYGVSKAAAELVAFREAIVSEVQAVIARPFNVIGPGQPEGFVCADIVRHVIEAERGSGNGVVRVRRLDTKRDLIDVRDVAAAFWELAQLGESGEAYNVSTGSSYSIQQVLDVLAGFSTTQFDVACDPEQVDTRVDVKEQTGDNGKIITHTEWRPKISSEESLGDMLAYARTSCC